MGTIADATRGIITEEAPRGRRNRGASAPAVPKATDTGAKRTKVVLKGRPTVKAKALVGVMTQDERKQSKAELEDFRLEIVPLFIDCVTGIFEIKAMSAADAELNAGALAQREEVLDEYLRSEEPWRTVAVLAYAEAFAKTCAGADAISKRSVEFTVRTLVDAGFITTEGVSQVKEKAPKDGVRVYDVNYVPTKPFLYRPETRQVMKVLGGLEGRAKAAGYRRMKEEQRQYRDDLAALHEMSAANPITTEDLLALIEGREESKDDGLIVMRVPDRKVPDNRPGKSGKTRTLQGGHILFRVAEGAVSVVEGIGRVQAVARALQESGASIELAQLGEERFKNSGPRLEEDVFQSTVRLHKMLRQAIAAAKQDAERPAQADTDGAKPTGEAGEYQSRATLTADGFFAGETGSFVLIREKSWKNAGPNAKGSTRNIVGLVTRSEDGKIGVECPDRLKPFFSGCQEPTMPGEDFNQLEAPLRGLLRWARRTASNTSESSEAPEQPVVTEGEFETAVNQA